MKNRIGIRMTITKICNPARKTKKHDKRQETEEQEVTALWFRIRTGIPTTVYIRKHKVEQRTKDSSD